MSELSAYAANVQANALARSLDGGYLRIYEADRVLTELRFGEPSAGPAKDGVLEFVLRADESALLTGSPLRFQAMTKDGTSVLSGSVGVSDADLLVRFASIVKGARVSVGKFSHRVPR